MPSPKAALADPAPSSQIRLLSPRLTLILGVQAVFGFGWSLYLIAPKFLVVTLGADAATVGRVSATGALASVLAIPIAATGLDRVGRTPFFRLGTALLFALSLAYLFVRRMSPFVYVLQACTNVAFSLAFNASATMVTDLAPPARLGQAIGVVGAANMAVNAIAIIVAESLASRYGWSAVFITGAAAAMAAFALSTLVREPTRRAEAEPMGPRSAAAWSVAPLIAVALTGVSFNALFTMNQPYALSLGATELRGFFVGFTGAGVLCRVVLGRIGDRFGHRRVSCGAALLYGAAAASMLALDPRRMWPFGALFGAAHGILYPTLNACFLETTPPSRRGRAMILYGGSFNVGSGIGGLAWGAVAARAGYRFVFLGAAMVALTAAAALFQRPRAVLRR